MTHKPDGDKTESTLVKFRSRLDEMIRGVGERIVPAIAQKAVADALQGLLPDALRAAVDEWRMAPLHVRFAALRQWQTADGVSHSPIPRRATAGNSGYDVVYCPPRGVTALQLRAQPAIPTAGVSVDKKGIVTVYPGSAALLPTGLALAVPEGCEAQVRSRSGLACRGVVVDNSPGTVDSDYRTVAAQRPDDQTQEPAEVKVLLRNHGLESVEFKPGERIAQLVFCEVQEADLEEVLSDKWVQEMSGAVGIERVGGFGSTG